MKLTFRIPDIELEVTIEGGSSQFFNMLLLLEHILHFLRTKEWLKQ